MPEKYFNICKTIIETRRCMREKARKLREKGLSYSEIAEKIGISARKATYWTNDIKLSKEEIGHKISEKKRKRDVEGYERQSISKKKLKKMIDAHGLYGASDILKMSDGAVQYWAEKYGIESPLRNRRFTHCQICNREYKENSKKCPKHCSTCTSKIRRLRSKIKSIKYKGGKCEECGFLAKEDNYAAFEFHHANSDKEVGVGMILNRKWEIIKREVDKCTLLCSNCHRVSHSDYDNKEILEIVKGI